MIYNIPDKEIHILTLTIDNINIKMYVNFNFL